MWCMSMLCVSVNSLKVKSLMKPDRVVLLAMQYEAFHLLTDVGSHISLKKH